MVLYLDQLKEGQRFVFESANTPSTYLFRGVIYSLRNKMDMVIYEHEETGRNFQKPLFKARNSVVFLI